MLITYNDGSVDVSSKTVTAIGAFYTTAQLKKHLKNGGELTNFEAKIPGTGRRKLSEGEKWANKFAKLSPEALAVVKAALPNT